MGFAQKIFAVMVLGALVIVGIGVMIAMSRDRQELFQKNTVHTDTYITSRGHFIEEVKLKDGTRCVVLNQQIECDWRK